MSYTTDLLRVRADFEDEAIYVSLSEGSYEPLVALETAEQLSVDRKKQQHANLFVLTAGPLTRLGPVRLLRTDLSIYKTLLQICLLKLFGFPNSRLVKDDEIEGVITRVITAKNKSSVNQSARMIKSFNHSTLVPCANPKPHPATRPRQIGRFGRCRVRGV